MTVGGDVCVCDSGWRCVRVTVGGDVCVGERGLFIPCIIEELYLRKNLCKYLSINALRHS